MEKNTITCSSGLAILPLSRLDEFVKFVEYTQAHCEALLDEILTLKEVLENPDNELKILKSSLD